MPSISNCILKDLQQTHNKIVNSNKPPNLSNLHSILTAIEFVSTSQSSDHDNMIKLEINQLLVDMLKCMESWKECREVVGDVKECVEMYEILVNNIARLGTKSRLPKLPQLCIKIISPILSTSKPSTILKLTQIKIPIITSLPLNLKLLQHLHKNSHPHRQQILIEFTRQLLSHNRAVGEIQTIFKLLIDILDAGSLEFYIAVRVLSALMHDYVKHFQLSYSRSGKYVGGAYQPRIIAVIIKALYRVKARFDIRQVTDEGEITETGKNQEGVCSDQHKRCNICGDTKMCQQTYLIRIQQSYYKIEICRECVKQMSNKQSIENAKLKQLEIIFHLIFNSEQPSDVPYFQQICAMLYPYLYVKSSIVIHSPSNSQLKLVRHALVTALFQRVAVGYTWDRLWAILMIVTNHEDAPTRLKSVKYLYQILQSCRYATQHVSKPTNQNILKCIKNRTIDTIPQIRIQSILCLLTILQNNDKQNTKANEDLGFVLSLIRQQLISPIVSQLIKNKQAINQGKICEVLDKLFLVSAPLINVQQNNANDDIDLDSRNIVGLFGCFSGLIVATRRLAKQSKEKKSRKTKKQEQTKQILKKHRPTLKKLFIIYRNRKDLMQAIIQYNFNEYPPELRQQCYNQMIDILIKYCGLTEDHAECYNNLLTGFQCKHENEEQNNVQKLIGDGDRSQRDGLWMENEMLLSWIVKYQGGTNIDKVVSQMLKICQDENNMISNGLISLAKQLKILLDHSQKAVPKQSIVQKLSNIRKLLLSDLLAESNTISIGCLINPVQTTQQDSNLRCLCELLISIQSYIGQGFKSTIAMYQRLYLLLIQLTQAVKLQHHGHEKNSFPVDFCTKQGISQVSQCKRGIEEVKDSQKTIENTDEVVRLAILTIKMMLAILPHLSIVFDKANSMNGQKQVIKMDSHLQSIFQNLALLINNQLTKKSRQDSLLLQSSHQLSILIRMNSQFLFQSQQVLLNLFAVDLPVPHSLVHFNRILFSINWILTIAHSVVQMERIRDIFMIFINQIFDSNNESRAMILNCRAFYLVICQIYKKGLSNLMTLGKFMLFGLTIDADQKNIILIKEREAIKQVCIKNVQQINKDNNQARQLYSSLAQTLKLCNSHYKLKQNHSIYLSNPSRRLPQKQTHLQQSLLKSLCNHLQRLAISNRLQSFNPQIYCQVMLISNTISRCKFMTIDDVKTILPTFMAVADSVYFQVLNQIRSSQDSRVGITLWAVLSVLAGILKGNQYKNVLNNFDKFYKFKDGVAQISIQPVKFDYCGVKSIQQLYEIIIQGRHSKLEQDYSDQQSTYDTQNKMRSNLSLPSTKPKKQKWKGKSKQKVPEQVKNTKRAIGVNKNKSNRSAPKRGLVAGDFVVNDKKMKDEDVEQYKTKLRVRKKMVI